MARGATIYRIDLTLSLVDRGVYAEERITVARHPSETLVRTLVRALAYGLRFEEGLGFGRGVSATEEPDLWSREGDGRVRQWIEVGKPDGKRLLKATRQAERVVVFAFGEGARRWRESELAAVSAIPKLSVAHLDDDFLGALSAKDERGLRWALTTSEGTLFLDTGETTLETTPEIWLGDPLG